MASEMDGVSKGLLGKLIADLDVRVAYRSRQT